MSADTIARPAAWRRKALFTGVLFLIWVVLLHLAWNATVAHPGEVNWNRYAYSDWLINYAGGFVRRGLAGEILRRLSGGPVAPATLNVIVFSAYLLFSLAMLAKALLFVARGRFLPALIFLLAPGGIYTMAAESEHYIRKEMLFVLFLWSVVAIGRLLAGRTRPVFVAYVGVGSLLLPFVHEGFIFFCSVPLALLLYNAAQPRIGVAVAQAYLSMCGLVFVVFAVFKGTPQAVLDIWQSIGPANRTLLSSTGQPELAIRTIGWSFWNALDLPVHVIEDGMAWYWLGPLVFSVAICIYLAVTTDYHPGDRRLTAGRALVLYGALLAGALPLFPLGWDWGRWIAFTTVAFLVVFDRIDRLPDPLERLARDVARRLPQALAGISALSVGLGLLVFELTFRMPACCITVQGSDWSILHTLARFTHRTGGG